jgi:serine/threonine protein phosphatase 1
MHQIHASNPLGQSNQGGQVSRVLRLTPNKLGRDFVVGDIHGAFTAVIEAMKLAKFNPVVDRIISLGDLIDRGPESARCLKFLSKPYVFAIKGNHEQNLLDFYSGGEPHESALTWFADIFNGQWWLTTPSFEREAILAKLSELPVVIELPTERGLVGFVQGDIPKGMDWQTFITKIETGDEQTLEVAKEGRSRIRSNDCSGVKGVDRVFVGHSIQRGGPARYGNVYAVDTGAILNELYGHEGLALTFADVMTRTQVLAQPKASQLPKVLVLEQDEDVSQQPFSSFS